MTALYLLFLFLSDEILGDVAAGVSGWIGSWDERRTHQAAERAPAYG